MMITTISQFVRVCGGRSPTAKAFGVVDTAVSNWQARGHFPGWALPRAMQIAHANKWALGPELFSVNKPRAKKRPPSKAKKRAAPYASAAE